MFILIRDTENKMQYLGLGVPGEGDAEKLKVKGAHLSPLESRLGWRGFAEGKGVAVEAPCPLGCTFLPLQ